MRFESDASSGRPAGAGTAALLLAVLWLSAAGPAGGAVVLDDRVTVGPEGYLENRFDGSVDLGPRLRATGGFDLYGDSGSETASQLRLGLEGSPAPPVYLGGGLAWEPPADGWKAWSAWGFVVLSTEPRGRLRAYPTALSVDAEFKRYELRPFDRWVELERRSIGVQLSQTFAGRFVLSAGYTGYLYDRDLNAAVTRLLSIRSRSVRDRILTAGRTLTGFPAEEFHADFTWLASSGRLSVLLSRTDPELDRIEETEYGLEVRGEYALTDRVTTELGWAHRSSSERRADYFTAGFSLFFETP